MGVHRDKGTDSLMCFYPQCFKDKFDPSKELPEGRCTSIFGKFSNNRN